MSFFGPRRTAPSDAAGNQASGGHGIGAQLTRVVQERDDAILRAEEAERQLNVLGSEMARMKEAAETSSNLQARLNQALIRAEGVEKTAGTLRQEKESAEGMVETMIEEAAEHGDLLEERNRLRQENTELKTRISGLSMRKSDGLFSVPDSNAGDDEVDRTEAAALVNSERAKRRRSEATKAHSPDPSRKAKPTASMAKRPRRRQRSTPPPQESQSDSELELLTDGNQAKATASTSRRRRKPSPSPSPQESQLDSELELPFDIHEASRPGYTAQPIPKSVWKTIRRQMAIWDEKRPEWQTQQDKLVRAAAYARKKSAEFLDGQENACSHCKKHGNVCVVVCGGRMRLLPVKGTEAMGQESEGYWKAEVLERKT